MKARLGPNADTSLYNILLLYITHRVKSAALWRDEVLDGFGVP